MSSKGGDLIPRQLSTVITVDGVEIITNKTLDGAFNTFSNIPNSALVKITDKTKLPDDVVYDATFGLNSLTDVDITSPQNNDVLKYNSAEGIWENGVYSEVIGISSLSDVNIASVANNHYLKYDSTDGRWENYALTIADLLSLPLSIAEGGTGQTAQDEAFDALAPTTTLGDLIYRGTDDNVRLAGNTTTTLNILTQTGNGTISAAPAWSDLATILLNVQNIFTDFQTIRDDTDSPLIVQRDGNTVNNKAHIKLQQKDSGGTNYKSYGAIYSEILVNTAGAEYGQLGLAVIQNGTLTPVLQADQYGLKSTVIKGGQEYGHVQGNIIRGTGADNMFQGHYNEAVLYKSGLFPACSATGGDGLFNSSMVAVGSAQPFLRDTTEGKGVEYQSDATSGGNAGLQQSSPFYRREWGSYMIMRIKPSTTTSIRAFFGWSSDNGEIAGEDPLNAISGVGLGKRSADTTWQIIRNDGSGATVFVDTGVSFAASFVTLEFFLDSNGYKCRVGTFESTLYTTELPAASTNLNFHAEIEGSASGAKSLYITGIFTKIGTI